MNGNGAAATRRLRLCGLGVHAGQLLFLAEGTNTLGGSEENALVLAEAGVSRHHARLLVEGGTVRLEDAGSRNGTFVNGRRIASAGLEPGDRVRFGPVEMELEAVAAGDAELGLVLGGGPALEAAGERTVTVTASSPESSPLYPPGLSFPAGFIPGEAPVMLRIYRDLGALAPGDLPILILGETGVGKEGIARLIHDSSPRRRRPFAAINAAALPAELLEAELFGIGEGVATGVRKRIGRLQQADGGTLFLDEIGDMPLVLQVKLLRALQEKRIEPLGLAPVNVDVRVVAATQVDLEQAMARGTFRRDLYYRVAGAVVRVPPLRERREDLPRLLQTFLARAAARAGKVVRGVSVSALEALTSFPWPGNVRELEHEAERLAQLCPAGSVIDSGLLDPRFTGQAAPSAGPARDSLRLEEQVSDTERTTILRALAEGGGSQRQAAKILGISRNTLARKLDLLGIRPQAEAN